MRLNDHWSCDGSICYTVYVDVDHFQTIRYSLTGIFKKKLSYTCYRLKSSGTMCNAGVLKLCLRSSPAAKESVNNEELSTYQELNFSLQENPYQCISR